MSVSSSANSRAESWISAAPRETSRVLHHGRALDGPAPDERAQARGQLRQREGLREVVVGAAVEAAHPILHGVSSGEHQDRYPDAVRAHPATGFEPVEPRHHHVQDDGVVVGGAHR
jgi:hypothetical protein